MNLVSSSSLRVALLFLSGMSACAQRASVLRTDAPSSLSSIVHIQNVPFYPDDSDQCGPSSLASVLNFWGKNVTVADLKSQVYVKRLKGSLPMDMLPALRAHGLDGKIVAGSFDLMKKELNAGRPLIAYLDFGTRRHPIGHYVVVTGYDDHRRGLYIHSALRRDKFASYRRFNRGWSDTDHWLLLAGSTGTIAAAETADPSGRLPSYRPALSAMEYVQLGSIYASENKHTEATNQYKRALKVDRRYTPAWVALGNQQLEAKQYALAEKSFQRALKYSPDDAAANNNLATVYLIQNHHLDRAEKLAMRATNSTLRAYAYDTLAQIYLQRGDIHAAQTAIESAMTSATGNGELTGLAATEVDKLTAHLRAQSARLRSLEIVAGQRDRMGGAVRR